MFQCCIISMFYCLPSPNGRLQDSGKSLERCTSTVSLTLRTHSLSKDLVLGVSEPDHSLRVAKARAGSSSLLLIEIETPKLGSF